MNKKSIKIHGFTLIELLVVIAIIALLMAVIMPALTKAKEQARMVMCASNNRQITLAVKVYADSNDDLIPSNELGRYDFNYDIARSESGGYWTNMGRLYRDGIIEAYEVFFCPSDKVRKPNVDYGIVSGGPLKTVFPLPSARPAWRIVGSYQYRIGRFSWRDERIRTAKLRSTTGIVGDAASFAKSATQKLFITHKDRCNYSYIDGHAEKIKLWPAYSDPDSIWWLHWIDQTSFRPDIYPFPDGNIPDCPWPDIH